MHRWAFVCEQQRRLKMIYCTFHNIIYNIHVQYHIRVVRDSRCSARTHNFLAHTLGIVHCASHPLTHTHRQHNVSPTVESKERSARPSARPIARHTMQYINTENEYEVEKRAKTATSSETINKNRPRTERERESERAEVEEQKKTRWI